MIVAIFGHAFKRVFPVLTTVLSAVYITALGAARGDVPPPTPGPDHPAVYVLFGVSGAATHVDKWDTTVGAHLALARVSRGGPLAFTAIEVGLSQFGERSGGRAWLAPGVGTRAAGVLVGLGAGPLAIWDRVAPPRAGAGLTLWLFAGVVPYVSLGAVRGEGAFVELGLRLSLPAMKLGRTRK